MVGLALVGCGRWLGGLAAEIRPGDPPEGVGPETEAALMEKCPKCGGELEMGYGLAGGDGIGVYWFCEPCAEVIDKFPDPEMQPPPETPEKPT
jgi:hypothetical protein